MGSQLLSRFPKPWRRASAFAEATADRRSLGGGWLALRKPQPFRAAPLQRNGKRSRRERTPVARPVSGLSVCGASTLVMPLHHTRKCLTPSAQRSDPGRSPSLPGINSDSVVDPAPPRWTRSLQSQIVWTSAADNLASRCRSVYEVGGMSPFSTASQISSTWFRETLCCGLHSEKFRFRRPSRTCRSINQEPGGTWLYQGHFVPLEWQSPQARWKTPATSGVNTPPA